ncbi:MAG: hypothetical protein CMM05_07475 [Rhodopirellula sp.]|nr:hypothetical protein [Rhodopirellula sp.]
MEKNRDSEVQEGGSDEECGPSILSGPTPTHHDKRRKYPHRHETSEVPPIAGKVSVAGARYLTLLITLATNSYH